MLNQSNQNQLTLKHLNIVSYFLSTGLFVSDRCFIISFFIFTFFLGHFNGIFVFLSSSFSLYLSLPSVCFSFVFGCSGLFLLFRSFKIVQFFAKLFQWPFPQSFFLLNHGRHFCIFAACLLRLRCFALSCEYCVWLHLLRHRSSIAIIHPCSLIQTHHPFITHTTTAKGGIFDTDSRCRTGRRKHSVVGRRRFSRRRPTFA